MKRFVLLVSSLLLLLSLTACSPRPYVFKQPMEQIAGIEIVDAKNNLEYTVKKSLSEEEQMAFLEEFCGLKFHTIHFGEPTSVGGNCVIIHYLDGSYEIISKDRCYYVKEKKPGKGKNIRRNCGDDQAFADLLNRFCIDSDE